MKETFKNAWKTGSVSYIPSIRVSRQSICTTTRENGEDDKL
jgi:hypothetical protein